MIENSIYQMSDFIISSFFVVITLVLFSVLQKYRLSWLNSYVQKVVKRVEQNSKFIARDYISKRYYLLYEKNSKLAYALSIIDRDYEEPFLKLWGWFFGVFSSKVETLIESSVYDLKKGL